MFFIRLKKYRSDALLFSDLQPLSLCYILERVRHIFHTESPLIHFWILSSVVANFPYYCSICRIYIKLQMSKPIHFYIFKQLTEWTCVRAEVAMSVNLISAHCRCCCSLALLVQRLKAFTAPKLTQTFLDYSHSVIKYYYSVLQLGREGQDPHPASLPAGCLSDFSLYRKPVQSRDFHSWFWHESDPSTSIAERTEQHVYI